MAVNLKTVCELQYKANDNENDYVVIDSTGGIPGTSVHKTKSMQVDGKIGGAFALDGLNDYIDTNRTFEATFRDSFSINLWVKVNDSSESNSFLGTGAESGAGIYIGMSGNRIAGFYYPTDGLVPQAVYSTSALPPGSSEWIMVTFVVEKLTSSTVDPRLYINGVLQSYFEDVKSPVAEMAEYICPYNLFVGAENYLGEADRFEHCTLDNVCIFNRAITQDEIDFLYAGGDGTEMLASFALTMSAETGGTVLPPTSAYCDGDCVAVTATPDAGYRFLAWTGTAVIAGKVIDPLDPTTTVLVDADYTLVANFVPIPADPVGNIEEALYTLLTSTSGVASIVGSRVYMDFLPQGKELPAITWTGIANIPDYHAEGMSGLARASFQLDCWAATHRECRALEKAVLMAFRSGARGLVGDVMIQSIMVTDSADSSVYPAELQQKKVYGKRIDIEIWFDNNLGV